MSFIGITRLWGRGAKHKMGIISYSNNFKIKVDKKAICVPVCIFLRGLTGAEICTITAVKRKTDRTPGD